MPGERPRGDAHGLGRRLNRWCVAPNWYHPGYSFVCADPGPAPVERAAWSQFVAVNGVVPHMPDKVAAALVAAWNDDANWKEPEGCPE